MGAVQVGQAEALLAQGVVPDLLIGASAGSVNAAYLAADPTLRGAAALRGLWMGTSRRQVFPFSPVTATLGLLGRRDHTVDNQALTRWLEQHLPYRQIEEARLGLTVTATDLRSGDAAFFSQGSLIPALLASCAMPGVFPPVVIGGRVLVDGGLAADAPIGRAITLGATRVYVLRTLPPDLPERSTGAAQLLLRALGVTFGAARRREIESWADRCDIYLVPAPSTPAISPFSFRCGGALMDAAAWLTTTWLRGARPVKSASGPILRP
jgi:NTE family protein